MTGVWVPSADGSYRPPTDWAAFYHAGYRLYAGYGGLGSSAKWTTATQLKTILSHGIGFAALAESTTDRMVTGGRSGGQVDANKARGYFRSIGYPDKCAIVYACDEDVDMTQVKGPITEYLKGCAIGDPTPMLPGFYGENDAIDYLYNAGLISVGFDAGAAWSWGNPAKPGAYAVHAAMRQESNEHVLAGGQVDIGHVLTSAPFMWPNTVVKPPAPTPAPVYVSTAKWTAHNTPWNSTLSGIATHEHTSVSRLLALNPALHGNANMIPYPGKIRVR